MVWLVGGEWVHAYTITPDRDYKADAAEMDARRVAAFQIRCPSCRRRYVTAVN